MLAPDFASEVAWGESAEEAILLRWLRLSSFCKGWKSYAKSGGFKDFDFYILDRDGFLMAYVEVKRRRSHFSKYGDAIFPLRKHKRARQSVLKHDIPFIGVTLYGCGTLVEVPLSKVPSSTRDIQRRDRPNTKPVPHAIFSKRQMTVLAEAVE
jgi:hypothetical protein